MGVGGNGEVQPGDHASDVSPGIEAAIERACEGLTVAVLDLADDALGATPNIHDELEECAPGARRVTREADIDVTLEIQRDVW